MENTFTLELTADQWKKLVAAAYIAGWVTTSHLEEEQEGVFDDLEETVLQQTSQHGISDLVVFNELIDDYSYTDTASEEFDMMLEEYDDLTFWEELATRMAERDVVLMKSLTGEKAENIMKLAEKYDTEFEKNGIKNLFLKK